MNRILYLLNLGPVRCDRGINWLRISHSECSHRVVGAGTCPDPGISQEAVATNEPFSHFGLDSAKAVGLLSRLANLWAAKSQSRSRGNTRHRSPGELSVRQVGVSVKRVSCPLFPVATWNQPIAVIGMACRFPGAPDPAAFWDLLRSGRSAFREITLRSLGHQCVVRSGSRQAGQDERPHGGPFGTRGRF